MTGALAGCREIIVCVRDVVGETTSFALLCCVLLPTAGKSGRSEIMKNLLQRGGRSREEMRTTRNSVSFGVVPLPATKTPSGRV